MFLFLAPQANAEKLKFKMPKSKLQVKIQKSIILGIKQKQF